MKPLKVQTDQSGNIEYISFGKTEIASEFQDIKDNVATEVEGVKQEVQSVRDENLKFDTMQALKASTAHTLEGGITKALIHGHDNPNDSAGGEYVWNPTSNEAPDEYFNIMPEGWNQAGRWQPLFPFGILDPLRFGAKPDWTANNSAERTDNYAAFQAMIEFAGQSKVVKYIEVPKGTFGCSKGLEIKNAYVVMRGAGFIGYSGASTKFMFPASLDTPGIKIHYTAAVGNAKAHLENFVVEFEGSNPNPYNYQTEEAEHMDWRITHSGIDVLAVCTLQDITVQAAPGNGLSFRGLVELASNASMCYCKNIISSNNKGSGFYMGGGDANQIQFNNCDARDNGAASDFGFGFEDRSFLGNHFIACHTNNNKSGSGIVSNPNACSSFISCYSESGQPPLYLNDQSIAVGGIHECGVSGGLYFRGSRVYGTLTSMGRAAEEHPWNYAGFKDGTVQFSGDAGGNNIYLRNRTTKGGAGHWSFDHGDWEGSELLGFAGGGSVVGVPAEHAGYSGQQWWRRTLTHGVGTSRAILLGGRLLSTTFDNLETQMNPVFNPNGTSYHIGDTFENAMYNGTNPERFKCIRSGVVGTYDEGLTISAAGDYLLLSAPTSVLRVGQAVKIGNIGSSIITQINGDKVLLKDGLGAFENEPISWITPLFKAIGQGAGPEAQKPVFDKAYIDAVGFQYYATDGGWSFWNGTQWVNNTNNIQ